MSQTDVHILDNVKANKSALPTNLVRREEVEHKVDVEEQVDEALHPEPAALGGKVKALRSTNSVNVIGTTANKVIQSRQG